jgi:dimethylargininase
MKNIHYLVHQIKKSCAATTYKKSKDIRQSSTAVFLPSSNNSNIQRKQYTTALTRKVPSSMNDALSMSAPPIPIHIPKATSQHEQYVRTLREKVGSNSGLSTIIEIDADDSYPDCVFIEDTAVVISDVAVITNIGAKSRRGEVDAVKDVLTNLGIKVHDMRVNDGNVEDDINAATLDGGDVLHPVSYKYNDRGEQLKKGGKHLFVGMSSRTNLKGVEYLIDAFPDVEVVPVDIGKINAALHLKSIVTHIDENTLLLPEGSLGDEVASAMDVKGRGYNVIRLKDLSSCNVVSVNGHVLAQPVKCKETKDILEREVKDRGMELSWVDASEFAKVDGALTCKSILL